MNALIKAYNVKNFVEFVVDFVYGILFSYWTQYKHGSLLPVHTVLVVFFYLFIFFLTRQRKSSIENAAPLTISSFVRWIWIWACLCMCVCVCLRHVYFPHHKHQKHTCFAFEKAKWVVCVYVWVGFFCFSFSLCTHLLNSMSSYCFLYVLYNTIYGTKCLCGTANLADWECKTYSSLWCFYA